MAKEFNKEKYMEFEREWFKCPHGYLRFGQSICGMFDMPKELEEKIYYETDTNKVQVIIWTSFNDTVSGKLTDEQIARQDFVDNEIHAMICNVLKYVDPENPPDWDIEAIAEIRDVILRYYIDGNFDQLELDFYPYLEE